MVVDGNSESALRLVLTDDVFVEEVVDVLGLGQIVKRKTVPLGVLELFGNDFIAQLNTFITDVYAGASNQLFYLTLGFLAKRTRELVRRIDSCHISLLLYALSSRHSSLRPPGK